MRFFSENLSIFNPANYSKYSKNAVLSFQIAHSPLSLTSHSEATFGSILGSIWDSFSHYFCLGEAFKKHIKNKWFFNRNLFNFGLQLGLQNGTKLAKMNTLAVYFRDLAAKRCHQASKMPPRPPKMPSRWPRDLQKRPPDTNFKGLLMKFGSHMCKLMF